MFDKRVQLLLVIAIVAAVAYLIASSEGTAKPLVVEKAREKIEAATAKRIYNYTPGTRPDYNFSPGAFGNLPPLPQDFWQIDEKFQKGEITDYIELGDEYWKQPEFYATFENNIDFMRSPQPGRIYAYGIGAYPGDIGVDAVPDSEFTVASFFFSSWLVQTYQGVRLGVVYPERTEIPSPDLESINFTVTQDPTAVQKYFSVTFEPGLFVLGPTTPAFNENWTRKIKAHIIVSNETPRGTYVIGVDVVPPPPEYSQAWLETYRAYSDAGAFKIGRAPFQIVVFVS